MKDGVRKPSGNRSAFNVQPYSKNLNRVGCGSSGISNFSRSNFGKKFSKGKKRGK